MSAYNQEFNKDNTILRYIIVALLAELKDKVYYYNQIDEDTNFHGTEVRNYLNNLENTQNIITPKQLQIR